MTKAYEAKLELLFESLRLQRELTTGRLDALGRFDERAIACTFMVHDRRTAYYLLGGYDAEDRHHGAGALAILTSIEEAQRRGLAVFDFEGSMIPAIERFFRGFGGELVHYFTVNRAWLPFEILLKWRKRSPF